MAEKPTVNNLANLTNESSAVQSINENFQKISTAFEDLLSTTKPTEAAMNVPLDMNGQRLINLPTPVLPTDPIRLVDRALVRGERGEPGPKGADGGTVTTVDFTQVFSFAIGNLNAGQTNFVVQGGYTPGSILVFLGPVKVNSIIATDGINVVVNFPVLGIDDVLTIVGTRNGVVEAPGENTGYDFGTLGIAPSGVIVDFGNL